ncbi:hypothetical protein DPMN_188984 [Dreissena polymorpha]|uniref:Uncharacterized protein n=1 Tax=Dreissena polymorpha TaxID=45954 RepID=A0A9D4IBU1_DREPO|nr:hypothetical protein DPMN_188984 [Dreissena polymorpha]
MESPWTDVYLSVFPSVCGRSLNDSTFSFQTFRTPCSHTSVHSGQQQALWSAGPLQDPMQSHICTQRTTTGSLVSWAVTGPHAVTHLYTADNNRLSGQLGLDARGQILGIGGELLGQEFGAKLNESYPKGTSSLTMGLQTSLLRGRYNLIYKGPYHHKFGPANDVPQLQHSHCISTGPQSLLQQQKLKLKCEREEELT